VKDELLEAQEIARKAGKIRFRGLSYHFNMPEMLEYTVKLGCIDVALLTYNFMVGDEVGNAIKKARATGLGIVGMKVMAGGYKRIERGDRLYGQDKDELTAKLKQPNAMLSALKYVMRNKSMDTAIIGMTDFEELSEDMRAMSEPFSDADEKLLAQQRRDIQPFYCQACGQCDGVCPKGVRVADTQRQLMYAEGYGQFAMAREDYLNQPATARAVSCEDCETCSVQCPNGLQVQANLIRAQQLFG
jgi:predicted aldo/keto reductase-like oxidoreductase